MRTVADFYQDCIAAVSQQPPLDVQLADAVSCVLAEDVEAPFDLPVADLAGCDGYAVIAADLEGARPDAPIHLPVIEEVCAGDVNPAALIPGNAIRIASGAPMPAGANAVLALDFTDHGISQVAARTQPAVGENIRRRAEDVEEGRVVLRKGTRVGARQVALLAGVGRSRVLVHPRPRVVILSIGDEIVEPGQQARPGTVFDANGHALSTAIADAGAQTFRVAAVPDERKALRETIEDQLVRADLILTTGGISYGSGDTVREVLGALGTVRFDNVAAWPGHILGVGTVGVNTDGSGGVPIFCLPGDPVSAQVCFEVYVRPALRHMQGWTALSRPSVRARVDRSWYSPRGRREFVRVRLLGDPRSGYQAKVMGAPASLLLSALADSNALAVVPEEVTNVRAGDELQCMVLE
ncbi:MULTISPECIES: molybdopterin molybdotransferase MoeA [unclassified Schaalia]|uniref:molybdopterin molybdotransferase MoeA n=1 Tax=unclassified Schaalia TaxID=2691889 RepID=UPI001E28DBE6|nr:MULTISPECIES: gephyrin-like molybdotransferase Glp [unclassified Schaalia]MCD4549012.1 molybdopterin molybdotransferase MoeA [Schaalia sp. lx-260]MCD4557624.1 molybdopterin molybdotransferase MoeA [Schaalia sp. lx-100]